MCLTYSQLIEYKWLGFQFPRRSISAHGEMWFNINATIKNISYARPFLKIHKIKQRAPSFNATKNDQVNDFSV